MRRPKGMSWLKAFGQWVSQGLYVIFFNGHPDVMTSAAAHSKKDREEKSLRGWFLRRLYFILNFLDKGHTERAWKQDKDEWDAK